MALALASLAVSFASIAGAAEVRYYPVPRGSHPHDVAPAPHGTVWYTGRGPYGIAATPGGEIYYASLAGNHIARIDTATGHATVIEPPTPGQGARRVWSDSKGSIWVSEWVAGNLSFPSNQDGATVRQMLGRAGEAWGAESGNDRLVVVIDH